jgi:sirohydrochlorin cobaltochelatase
MTGQMAWDSRDEGVLLVGHGTRDAAGVAAFFELARLVQDRLPGGLLAPCFLEFAEPTIEQGVDLLAKAGVTRILAMPLMLFAAGHVRRDIPKVIAAAASRYSGLQTRQAAHLGCSEPLVALSAERFRQTVSSSPLGSAEKTALVLVGRGNRDVEALAEMHHFADLRREMTPVARVEICFLAMAKPSLSETLALVPAMSEKRIVVQPHLLFPGRLAASIRQAVAAARSKSPEKTWLVAQPLGPDRLLADVVLAMASGAPSEDTPCSESALRVRSLVSRYRLRG